MEVWHDNMKIAEQALALKNPALESAYVFDDLTEIGDKNKALGLYNCLIPKIKSGSYKMMSYDNSIRQKDILKELQIERLIKLDIASDDKQYNPSVLKHNNRVLKF